MYRQCQSYVPWCMCTLRRTEVEGGGPLCHLALVYEGTFWSPDDFLNFRFPYSSPLLSFSSPSPLLLHLHFRIIVSFTFVCLIPTHRPQICAFLCPPPVAKRHLSVCLSRQVQVPAAHYTIHSPSRNKDPYARSAATHLPIKEVRPTTWRSLDYE